ncbi:ALA-interacting subunit 1 [Linum perenne]
MESKETHGSVGGASTSSSSSSSSKKKQSKRPKYSRFSQQELPACKFIITPTVVIATFVAIAIVFIPLGLASLFASDHVVEIVHRYDNLCLPESSNAVNYIQSKATNKTCAGKLTVSKEMKGPIFIYYQLDNFYQNHRRIEGDLQVNDIIELVVENNYNTYSFGGKKWLILSTTSWIGGKNEFLGIAYLTIGGLCLFLAVTFILIYVLRPR